MPIYAASDRAKNQWLHCSESSRPHKTADRLLPTRNRRSMNQAYDLCRCIGHYPQLKPVKTLFQLGKAQHLSASTFFLMKLNVKKGSKFKT
jgi:hypothetical protein